MSQRVYELVLRDGSQHILSATDLDRIVRLRAREMGLEVESWELEGFVLKVRTTGKIQNVQVSVGFDL